MSGKPASNEYAEAARARKVAAMVAYFDRVTDVLGFDPHDNAIGVVAYLCALTDDEWRAHAVCAGQRPPSEDSVLAIIAVYERRFGPLLRVVPVK